MMNMKGSHIALFPPTFTTCIPVALPYFVSQGRAKLFWVANVKSLASIFCFYRDAIWAIDFIAPSINQTMRFYNRLAAPSTGNLNRVIMSIIRAFSRSGFAKPGTLAFLTAKAMFGSFQYPRWTLNYFSAFITFNILEFIGLYSRPVTRKEFSLLSSFIIFVQGLTTPATALNNRIFHADILLL